VCCKNGAQLVTRSVDIHAVKTPHDDSEQPWHHDDTPHEERPTSHEHEHEHAHAGEEPERSHIAGSFPFPHEKLDAYKVAVAMPTLARKLAKEVPRGHRNIADHMLRAASNTVLLLAEGANRRGAGEKRQRFAESRGECGEVGAAGDLLLAFEIGPPPDAEALKRFAARVSAMLTRLIARLDRLQP
jgi:four helix bundle protein